MNIGGVEVPEPLRVLPASLPCSISVVDYTHASIKNYSVRDTPGTRRWLALGICHSTPEGAGCHLQALIELHKGKQ